MSSDGWEHLSHENVRIPPTPEYHELAESLPSTPTSPWELLSMNNARQAAGLPMIRLDREVTPFERIGTAVYPDPPRRQRRASATSERGQRLQTHIRVTW